MPERTFGRTVRYRRTKLGMSQAKLAELVGRSTPTIRAWERDRSTPNDPKVLSALAAVLGVDEGQLFDKAGVELPQAETSPTVEQALATLSIEDIVDSSESKVDFDADDPSDQEPDREPAVVSAGAEPPHAAVEPEEPSAMDQNPQPAYVAPPDPLQKAPLTPSIADLSYIEDDSQRQLYRVRNLATLVAVVALVIAFIWALGEGLGALDAWWEAFFQNLRL